MTHDKLTTCFLCEECCEETQRVCQKTASHQSWQVNKSFRALLYVIIEELRIDRLVVWLIRKNK